MSPDSSSEIPDSTRAAWKAASIAALWETRNAHRPDGENDPPHLWAWRTLKPLVANALTLTSPSAVERRVLMLLDPARGTPENAITTTNLAAALQILKPGETARPHRHSMNALRFVLEGSGAVTIVDGKPCPMEQGDLILTPGWCWHEHTHGGSSPIVWLDVLDRPCHDYLGTSSFQPGPVNELPVTVPDTAFAAANFLPVHISPSGAGYSPVFRYPWTAASGALSIAPRSADGCRRLRYVNPLTGGAVMSLLDCELMEIDPNGETAARRSTASMICSVIEGRGSSRIGGVVYDWEPGDIFTVPHGNWFSHHAAGTRARLFNVSDREILRRLDLLKEESRDLQRS
jgi:gentisate 1,2-dioxygenase